VAGLHGPPRRLRPPGEFLSKEKNRGNLVRGREEAREIETAREEREE
jgi:hypothetical protein